MEKSQFDKYTSGVVEICEKLKNKIDFSKPSDHVNRDNFKRIVKLNYEEVSKRIQDMTFAEQNGFSLDMKIKTRKVNSVTSKHVAVIGDMYYSIKYIDSDSRNLYIYLEGVDTIAQ